MKNGEINNSEGNLENRSIARRVIKKIYAWRTRSQQRKQLASLSEHMLKDMGLTRYEVNKEVDKPFWRS